MCTDRVLRDIKRERSYQTALWGSEFDSNNTLQDWNEYVSLYLSKANQYASCAKFQEERDDLIKVVSLLVARIEQLDKKYPDLESMKRSDEDLAEE